MSTYAIDFETDYDKKAKIDVGSLGVYHYARHPFVEIYLMSVACDDGTTWVGNPVDFNWESLRGAHVVSHNRGFDGGVEDRLVELGIKPADLVYSSENCTADMAAYLACPRALKDAARVMLGKTMSKDIRDEASGKPWRQRTLQDRTAMRKYALGDAIACLELWQKYNSQWPLHEQKLSQITRKSAKLGVRVDKAHVKLGIAKMEEVLAETIKEIPWVGKHEPLSPEGLKEYCAANNIPAPETISEDEDEYILWENYYGERFPVVNTMRRYRKANLVYQKLLTLKSRIRPDRTAPIGLKYAAAESTLRWGGADKFNVHNLGAGEVEGFDIRACLISRAHKQLFDGDYKSIEPICGGFLTKNWPFLDLVRSGIDVYEAAASTMGLYSGEKGKMAEDKTLRSLVKVCVLGMSYGLSNPEKLQKYAKLVGGLDLEMTQCSKLVKDFKTNNPLLVKYWDMCQKYFSLSGGEDFKMKLPSGRTITWWNVSRMDGSYLKTKGMEKSRRFGWGTKAYQNCTQGLARDCLANAIINLDNAGHTILWHVHDAIVVEVANKVEAEEVARIMQQPPDWAPNLPLIVDWKLGRKYCK